MSEATTIDTLSIEITTNAHGAAQGIDGIAEALGRLKENGKVSVAIKNLNNLSGALKTFTQISDPSHKLRALHSGLQSLQGLKSVAPLANSISKLGTAMNSVRGMNLDGVDTQFDKLASAAGKLSGVKAGGLGTMVNALAKIGKVTDSLDDGTIDRFTQRVEKLNSALTPLSSKMTSIQAGLRGVNSKARSAGDGVRHLGTKVNATTLNMASMITVIQGIRAALQPVVYLLKDTISQAMEWDGVAARFGRGFGANAQETYEWIQRLNEEMGINVQQFMQYSSVYATMLTGFGVAMEDAGKMALGYTELTYDIWAGYNDIYKRFEDAAEAVKSAIAGEVEPVRRAGFTIVESTLEQTAANHGLEISLEKATEAQKSYLRYLTLVDQAHAQGLVGTYAAEMNTAEGAMRTFSQQLKSLSQAFGSLFIPVLVKVMPYIQAFVAVVTEAVHWLAALFGMKIQPISFGGFSSGAKAVSDVGGAAEKATDSLGGTSKAVGDTTKKLKELKNATLGIDELNVISPPDTNTGSSGGGGGGGVAGGGGGGFEGLEVDSLWDEAIFDNIQSKVNDIKNKIKDFFNEFKTEIQIVSGLLAALGVAKMLKHLGEAIGLGNTFLKTMETIAKLAVTGIVIVLQYTLMTEFFKNYIDSGKFKEYIKALFVGALGTFVLYSMWGPTGLIIGLGVTAAASLKAVIDNGGIDSTESAMVALTGLASAVGALGIAWSKMWPILKASDLAAYFLAVKQNIPDVGLVAAMFPKLSTAISGAASAAGTFLAGISAPVWAAIVVAIAAVVAVVVFLKEHWDEVTAAVKRFFDENIAPKIDSIKESFRKLGDALRPILDFLGWLIEPIARVIQGFKEWWAVAEPLKVLGDIFEVIGGVIVAVLGGAVAGAFQTVMGLIDGFIQTFTGLVEIVVGVVKGIVAVFTGGDIQSAVDMIIQGVVDTFEGLWKLTVGAVVDFVDGVIGWFTDLWDELVGHSIVPDTIDGIVECFKGLPGKVLGLVGNFVNNIIGKFSDFGTKILDKIKSGWDTVKSWWGGKSGMESVQVGISLFKKGWSTVKDWIGKIPGIEQAISLAKRGWSTVKGWVGSIATLSQKIGLVKSGWSSVKKWVGSMPKLNQAIGLAKSGWSSVKSWVGSMPKLNVAIGLVKSGWTSIKKWLGSLTYKLTFKLPKIRVKWGEKTVAGFKISYPNGFETYAKGGFPNMGEMFIAREAGPEMVGKIGNKTAVANNDQIVAGISEGVYAAVIAAMKQSENSGNQAVNVYLDGRQITASVEKRQRERGANITRNGVYAY